MTDTTTPAFRHRPRLISQVVPWFLLLVAVVAFVGRAYSFRFVQADSYITYRYARNVVRGLGPVYNPGERVEGYTNFLWMMVLTLFGTAGVPFSAIIAVSQVLGVMSGIGVIVIFFLLLRKFSTGPPVLTPLATLLFAANGTFAYWCVSGMETGLFSLLLAGGFYSYLVAESDRGLVWASYLLGLSALTRPEGALFFGIVLLHFAVLSLYRRSSMTGLVLLIAPFLVVVAPLYLWRLGYYGYPFPNTFYAKAGLDATSLRLGLKYLTDFYRAYGFWGLGVLIPIAAGLWFRKKTPVTLFGFCILALAVHAVYVVSVGGDVLRQYRFFVPLYVLFYFILSETIWLPPIRRSLAVMVMMAVGLLTFWGPFTPSTTELLELNADCGAERHLVRMMHATGTWLNAHMGPDDWFACSTIGAVGYFSDRNQVDMLGLTDAVVAHEPESILGSRVYWKERRYNSRHVLERNPAFICFSTGAKPSAAAERALFLRSRFRRGYFPYRISMIAGDGMSTYEIFKAKPGADSVPIETPAANTEFIESYSAGINLAWGSKYDSAIASFRQCCEFAPADFAYGYERIGRTYLKMKQDDSAKVNLQRALAIDEWCLYSHLELGRMLANQGNCDSAILEFRAVVDLDPDCTDGYDELSDALSRSGRFDASESVLVDCATRFPGAPDPALRISRARLLAGDIRSAQRRLAEFLTRSPDNREARALLDSIGRLHATRPGQND